jgi:broad specificity phosphatase PhoE
MEKIISILNEKNEDKINFDFNKQDYFFCCTYCFKITKEKNLKYLGLITPNILRNDHIIVKDNNNKMLDPSKRNNRFLVVMRHGERIDNLPEIRKKQELPNYDPELTFEGMQQAINIGTQLRNLLRYKFNIEINEINIFNSPSARTLQTGILAAGALDYLDKIEKIIRIITDLNETSVRGGFENNKKESPIYYYKDKDKNWNDLYNKYINSLIKDRNYRYSKMDFSSILGKEPLEDPEIMQKRAENVITNIKGFIESTYEQDCNTMSIVATHQLNVSMIVEFLIKEINKERKEKNMDVINLTDQSFGYCCSYIFKIDENNEFSYIGLLNPNVFDSFEYNLI